LEFGIRTRSMSRLLWRRDNQSGGRTRMREIARRMQRHRVEQAKKATKAVIARLNPPEPKLWDIETRSPAYIGTRVTRWRKDGLNSITCVSEHFEPL